MLQKSAVNSGRRVRLAEFLRGFRDIFPVMIATIPFGLLFGAIAVKKGISVADATLMSASTYGGAAQFAVLEFWAHPLPFWTVLMSGLAVNLRNVLYSASLGRKMTHWKPSTRYAAFALLTDPSFAISELKEGKHLSAPYYFGLGVPLYVNWVVTTAIGATLGNFITHPEVIGIDFLVTAYFLVVVVGFRARSNTLPVIGASAGAALAVYLTSVRHGISSPARLPAWRSRWCSRRTRCPRDAASDPCARRGHLCDARRGAHGAVTLRASPSARRSGA